MEATGFEGHSKTTSADSIASSTPGAGRASELPTYRMALTSFRAPRSTQYSWKWRSRAVPASSTASIRVVTGSSVIGRIRLGTPKVCRTSLTTWDRRAPSASRGVR